MSIKYDPEIIETAARALYEEANTVVRNTMIKYGFLFFILGLLVGIYFNNQFRLNGGAVLVISLIISVVGIFVGRNAAAGKAFVLKLQAQTALCQVEIEKSSRA